MILAHVADPGRSPWAFHLHPDVSVAVVALAAAYLAACRWLAPLCLAPGETTITRRQRRMLVAGLVLLWAFSEWPIHDLAEGFSYIVHMVQHSVYSLVVPPLLILGTPVWLWRAVLGPALPVVRQLVRPIVAVLVFGAVTLATHLPVFVNAAVNSGLVHGTQHMALLLASGLVWWPLLSPLPELGRLTRPIQQMVYLFCSRLVPAIAGSSLIWAQGTPYRAYERFPSLWGIGDLQDQRWAGAVMEIGEGVVLWGLMVVIVLRACRTTTPGPDVVHDRSGPAAARAS